MAIARDAVIVGILVIGGYALIIYTLPAFYKKLADQTSASVTQPLSNLWYTFFPTDEQIEAEGLIPDSWGYWNGEQGWIPDWLDWRD